MSPTLVLLLRLLFVLPAVPSRGLSFDRHRVRGERCRACGRTQGGTTLRVVAMLPVLNPQWPRGPTNPLHNAARRGCVQGILAVLAFGLIDVDLGDPEGCTPLFIATMENYPAVVDVLLRKGASVVVANNASCTPLHISALKGHVGITHMLLRAGSQLDAANIEGQRPIHMAAAGGHSPVVKMLLGAGADPDECDIEGHTALYAAAFGGYLRVCRDLLKANAKPGKVQAGPSLVPLDVAAKNGHPAVVRELLKLGLEAGGGPSGGVNALRLAAKHECINVMAILREAGVVDTGEALTNAVTLGRFTSVKFLLQQKKQPPGYVNFHKDVGVTPVMGAAYSASPRIVRMLLDHGADESMVVLSPNQVGGKFVNSAMDLVRRNLEWKELQGVPATQDQLYRLEAIRRLLLQANAVRATSWLWPGGNTYIGRINHDEESGSMKSTAAPHGKGEDEEQMLQVATPMSSAAMREWLRKMLRTTGSFRTRPGRVPVAGLFRYSEKR